MQYSFYLNLLIIVNSNYLVLAFSNNLNQFNSKENNNSASLVYAIKLKEIFLNDEESYHSCNIGDCDLLAENCLKLECGPEHLNRDNCVNCLTSLNSKCSQCVLNIFKQEEDIDGKSFSKCNKSNENEVKACHINCRKRLYDIGYCDIDVPSICQCSKIDYR
jgi:hypothetical protein